MEEYKKIMALNKIQPKFIILSLLILFCLLFSGCVSSKVPATTPQLSTPAVTTTAQTTKISFVTYKDPIKKFSIDYPTGWKMNPIASNSNIYSIEFYPVADDGVISVSVIPQQPMKGVKQWGQTLISDGPKNWPGFLLINQQEVNISGVPGMTIEYTGNTKQNIFTHFKVTLVEKGNSGYMIMYVSYPDSYPKYSEDYAKMVKSFVLP